MSQNNDLNQGSKSLSNPLLEKNKTIILVPYWINNALMDKNLTIDNCLNYELLSKVVSEADIVSMFEFNEPSYFDQILSVEKIYDREYDIARNNQSFNNLADLMDFGSLDKNMYWAKLFPNGQQAKSGVDIKGRFIAANANITVDNYDKSNDEELSKYTKEYLYNIVHTRDYLFIVIGKNFFTNVSRNAISNNAVEFSMNFLKDVLKNLGCVYYDAIARHWLFFVYLNFVHKNIAEIRPLS
jgi:hypothetical protein